MHGSNEWMDKLLRHSKIKKYRSGKKQLKSEQKSFSIRKELFPLRDTKKLI